MGRWLYAETREKKRKMFQCHTHKYNKLLVEDMTVTNYGFIGRNDPINNNDPINKTGMFMGAV